MTELKVTQKRHYSAHNDLLRVGGNFLHACELDERWCGEGDFVCLIMCALAVESICNTVGELIYNDWRSEFETCSPKAKIRIICEKLNITYDKGKEPFQTLHWLIGFRNKIAHAKPEPIEKTQILSQKEYDDLQSSDGPQSKLEGFISVKNANKAMEQLAEFQELLVGSLPEEEAWVIESDSWEMYSEPNRKS